MALESSWVNDTLEIDLVMSIQVKWAWGSLVEHAGLLGYKNERIQFKSEKYNTIEDTQIKPSFRNITFTQNSRDEFHTENDMEFCKNHLRTFLNKIHFDMKKLGYRKLSILWISGIFIGKYRGVHNGPIVVPNRKFLNYSQLDDLNWSIRNESIEDTSLVLRPHRKMNYGDYTVIAYSSVGSNYNYLWHPEKSHQYDGGLITFTMENTWTFNYMFH
ncbi:hypothetical protein [[Acholeplasma] multilocale]|uniref:hypothetical protein n=1 Tax=[Acholeplasma] multilocale TaxID=264638 RepID=UPI0012EB578C|nr:hypothetical protein [[Acholeplasma] multilocale]